jgi:hypothetical protein
MHDRYTISPEVVQILSSRKLIESCYLRWPNMKTAALGYPEAQQANVQQNFEFILQERKYVEVYAIPGNDPNVSNFLTLDI